MSLKITKEVGIKFAGYQAMEKHILEEEYDANVQQKFNRSTCSVCNKDETSKYILCSECHIYIHYKCMLLPNMPTLLFC